MSWKKHFVVYQNKSPLTGPNAGKNRSEGYTSRFQSWLPEVYTGMPNRTERYMQYDQMDMDSEINMALDTIAEFATQLDEETSSPFKVRYLDDPTESEAKIIKQVLKQWCNINDWDRRIFKTFRNVIKYGDQPFVRDPETWQLLFVQPQDVSGVVINESKGKEPEQYIIRNLDLNLQNKTATTPIGINRTTGGITNSTFTTLTGRQSGVNTGYSSANISNPADEFHVDSNNVVHVAMTEGMDPNFPFGSSILDPIFKTYKQKELLEDSIIIYRVQRAPERRVFYIDVGDMPAHRASAFLEKVKMEVHQKRIPNKTGGGSNIMDAQYNPLCLALDTKIPLLDGRTLELNELINEYQDGKENWAYSCDPETGKIVPGVITWAGITRKDTQVIKLTFDNGESLTVTPDHKIPVFGKGFVEAKDLTPSDSLISFETRQQKLPSSKNKTTYTQVYDHNDKEWTFVHRMVGEYFRKLGKHQEFTYIIEGNKNIVHHKDFNRYNNDPKNLQWMNKEDHFKFHGDSNFWANVSPEEAVEVKEKIRTTLVERWKNLSNEDRIIALDHIIKAQKKAVNLRNTDSYVKEKYSKTMRAVRLKFLEKNPEFVKDVLLPNLNTYTENYPNQNKVYSFRMLQIISETVKKHNSNKKQTIELLSNNEEFLEEIRKNNPRDPSKNYKILNDKVTVEIFERTLFHFGYKGWKDFVSKLEVFNHRITNIEYINEKQDTGTITIDGKEKWHNYHTFATESGIFVKNSIMEDFFFAQGCLVLDTKLPLLDGRTLTLEEVIKEHQEGKENWVYGLSNVTHELEPAKIKWAGITRRDAKVLEVRLDNGESVIATPDHKFILRDGTEVEAQNLKSGDSLMPLNLELGHTGPNQKSKQYMKYVSNNNGKKKFVHTTIAKKPVGKDTQVHHIDFNSQNNNPNNLNVMTTEDHIALHKSIGTYSLTNMWKTEEGRNKLISGMKKLYENPSEKFTISLSKRNSKNAKKYWNKFTEEEKKVVGEKFVKTLKENTENRKIKYSIEMFNAMVSAFDRGHTSVKKLGKELRIDDEFHNAYLTANPSTIRDPNMSERLGVTDTTLNRIVNVIGYKTFGDWKVEYTGIPKYSNKVAVRQNHKILEVIELDYTIDTGDITIESESGSHWFGLGAGIYVHNSDGRGSKVEVLPGGDNLGEISDLKFFTDKMMRGLRIPSSYMPLSSDDSGAVFTDGRVGTAFIQEFRFNKYCQRLQNIIQPVFDREFKRFLKHRGFNIDASMFDLIFTEPQSFSQYRQIELDSAKAGVFGQLEGSKYLSRRFLLKKYLGLSPAEILENEQMYMEENPKGKIKASDLGDQMGLSDVGIRGNEFEDFGDMNMGEPVGDELGGEGAPEASVSPIGSVTPPAQGGQEGQQR
jgi:hypothetical protein